MTAELIQLTTFGTGEKNGGRGITGPATAGVLSECDMSDPGRASGGRTAGPLGSGGGSRVSGPDGGMPMWGRVPICGGPSGRGGGIPMNGGGGMPSGGHTGG